MEIVWHGYSCVTVKTKQAVAVIDPYSESKGLKLPPVKADILVVTKNHEGDDNVKAVGGQPMLIDWPGEYETNGVAIMAFPIPETKAMCVTMIADGMKLCFVGNQKKELSEDMIENIGNVDILIIPVGGNETMDAKMAHKLIEQIEPRVILPVNYAVDGAKVKLDPAEGFLKLIGASAAEPKDKFVVSGRSDLREDATECVVLNPQKA